MNKHRRWPWIALAVVTALVLVSVLALPALLDVERYRGRIESALAEATGWDARLGEIDFSVLRGMAVTVSPASLSAPGGETSRVEIGTLAVRAALLPLLNGRLEIRSVVLDRPVIDVVRVDEALGWVLPAPPPPAADDEAGDTERGRRLQVSVQRVEVRDGVLELEDRAADPPLQVRLEGLDVVAEPPTGEIRGDASLGGDGGRVEWRGSLGDGLEIELVGLRTEVLHPWLGDDLVHAGGRVSGTLTLRLPLRVEGRLTAESLTLLAGEQPFERARVDFAVAEGEGEVRLERFEFEGDGAVLAGEGTLAPALALDLELRATPLEAALRASRSVLPLPLDASPPGSVQARLRVDQAADGELGYDAAGTMSAATFRIADMLPPARDVRAEFELGRDGALEIRILDGQAGGGPLSGTARMASVDPPGELVFEGGIREAVLGQLLAGLVRQAEDRVTGPTGIEARVGLDLSRADLDARALGGRIDVAARTVQLPGWDLDSAVRKQIDEKLSLSGLKSILERKLGVDKKSAEEPGPAERVAQLFERVELSVDLDAWPWRLERLALAAGGVEAAGSGTFDPLAGSVDLAFTARLDAERSAEWVREHDELKVLLDRQGRLALPLELDGPLLAPSIDVDLRRVLAERLDAGDGDDTEKKIRGLVEGLLKRDD